MKNIRVLAVEDDPLFIIHLEQHLEEMEHELVGWTDNSDNVEAMVAELHPELILMDISIKGSLDGVQLSTQLRQKFDTPIIFLTANNDIKIFQETKSLSNTAHMIKPFDRITLGSSIEGLMKLYSSSKKEILAAPEETIEHIDGDAFFVKIDSKRIKVPMVDILFIQADGNYCYLHTIIGKKHAIKSSLRKIMGKLKPQMFEQIHRKYLVQFDKIESLDLKKNEVNARGKILPLGGQFKDPLQSRMNLI